MDFSLTEPERDLVGLCREFAQKEIAPRAPARVGRGAVPDRPAPRDGCAGPARHADPGAVGRHRHVDRRLRRRDGAARPRRPVGGGRVAGARDDRFVAAVPLRHRRAARALAATVGRRTRARRVRSDRARRRFRRARHPHAGGTARRRLADQRPQDVHLQRRHRHVVRRDAARAHRVGRRAGADASRASSSRRTRPASRWARSCAASAGAASTPASCSSTTSGSPTITSSAIPRWGSASSCARSRSGASRSPRCRSA